MLLQNQLLMEEMHLPNQLQERTPKPSILYQEQKSTSLNLSLAPAVNSSNLSQALAVFLSILYREQEPTSLNLSLALAVNSSNLFLALIVNSSNLFLALMVNSSKLFKAPSAN
jgi:hypothetical protein